MIMTINGIDYYHIKDFAALIGLSIPAVRHLCNTGGIRRLDYIRDGSRILIKASEATEYPFIPPGKPGYLDIYHYVKQEDGTYQRELCSPCTYRLNTEKCPEAERLYGRQSTEVPAPRG